MTNYLMGILLKLLGIGRAIVNWVLGLVKAVFDFAAKRPLLAFFIVLDLLLIAGCWWGFGRHRDAQAAQVQVTALEAQIVEKDSLIEQLYQRLQDYALALDKSHSDHTATIRENNDAVQGLKRAADKQLARAQEEALKSKAQRDRYFALAERYRGALVQGGTPEERIAREEAINQQFIRDFREVRP